MKSKIKNVLSLCDGIGGGMLALKECGIDSSSINYYASEVDKTAIKVANEHFPSIIQLGDIRKWREWKDLPSHFDLILSGSPCKGFSYSGKMLNFEDKQSKLFFDFVDILNHFSHSHFLFENVNMKQEYIDVINQSLGGGVTPHLIDSATVSPQTRLRNYWTDIPFTSSSPVKGWDINLIDILDDDGSDGMINCGAIRGRRINPFTNKRDAKNTSLPYTQCLEVKSKNSNKSNCLTTVAKDNILTSLPIGGERHPDAFSDESKLLYRYYSKRELCLLQTLPPHYLDNVNYSQAVKLAGNGWTIQVIADILQGII